MTTDAPCSSAARISDRAGSMPPITSTTTSTSPRVTRPCASRGEQLCRNVGAALQVGAAYGDADQLDGRAHARGQVGGLVVDQPGDLAADDATAEKGDAERLAIGTHDPDIFASSLPSPPTIPLADPAQMATPDPLTRRRWRSGIAICDGSRTFRSPSATGQRSGSTSSASRSSSVSRRTTTRAAPSRNGDDRGAEGVVVVAGHRAAVRPRARHRDQVAGCDVAGQELVLDHDVARLAVLADHADQQRGRVGAAGGDACTSSRRRTARCGCCRSCRRRRRRRCVRRRRRARPP